MAGADVCVVPRPIINLLEAVFKSQESQKLALGVVLHCSSEIYVYFKQLESLRIKMFYLEIDNDISLT